MFNLTETPVSDFVTIDTNGRTTTTSLKVAEFFDKRHADVLRDIDTILTQVSDIFGKRNFALTEYELINNLGFAVKQPMYLLTEAGFMMLAMGYTGEKAMQIKEAYIAEFENMREFVETKRDEYIVFQESKNKQLVSETTAILKKVENDTRSLAGKAMLLDCDLNMYRTLLRESIVFNEECDKSKRRPSSHKYTDNVMLGNLDYILDRLKYRLEYEDKLQNARFREIELLHYELKHRTKYEYPKLEDYIETITSSILN